MTEVKADVARRWSHIRQTDTVHEQMTGMPVINQRPAPGWRRLVAGGVDYGIVAAYLVALGLAGALGRVTGLLPRQITTPGGRILAQLVVLAVLTLPLTLWFAWWETAPRAAPPGKRLLGLRVSRLGGGGLSWSRSLVRSTVKIAVPWELAHTGVWNSLAWPGPETPVNVLLFTVANILLVLYVVMLFFGAHRPPYDRLAGTVVQVDHRNRDHGGVQWGRPWRAVGPS